MVGNRKGRVGNEREGETYKGKETDNKRRRNKEIERGRDIGKEEKERERGQSCVFGESS